MTANEVAKVFGVTRRTVYAWIERGCPCEKVQGKGLTAEWEFDLNQVHRWRKIEWNKEGQ